MKTETIALSGWPFDLAATLHSGQVFHWHPHGRGFAGLIGSRAVYLEQPRPDTLLCTAGQAETVSRYLGLDHDMAAIAAGFPAGDEVLRRAIDYCPGIRLLSQPPWECLATFITSSMKRVPHIRQMSLTMRARFGKPVRAAGLPEQHAYPDPAAFAAAGEDALRACGLGYRAKFLHQTASALASGAVNLDTIPGATLEDALITLRTLPGVGEKIASCALLFGWEKHGAFPVDVWVERILRRLYFPHAPETSAKELREFAFRHFGEHRGYAQQFLFHHARVGASVSS